jgi:lysylphosphatidylglycerol synthetase-like protein (DUF2156 family)
METKSTIERARNAALRSLRPARTGLRVGLWLALVSLGFAAFATLKGSEWSIAPMLVALAVAVPCGLGAWQFERNPVVVAKWASRGSMLAISALIVALIVGGEFIWVALYVLTLLPFTSQAVKSQPEQVVGKYVAAGGRMDELFLASSARDRRLITPHGVLTVGIALGIFASLVLVLGSAVRSGHFGNESVIGIGGR